jgi:hypothetical protein
MTHAGTEEQERPKNHDYGSGGIKEIDCRWLDVNCELLQKTPQSRVIQSSHRKGPGQG